MSEDFELRLDEDEEDLSEKKENFSYTKYMLLHKIPPRFVQITIPEMIISLLLYLGNRAGFFEDSAYNIGLIFGLCLYWIITWIYARKDCKNTRGTGHYYVCNIVAFSLFVLIAAVSCYFASKEPTFPAPSGFYFFPLFRLSLVLALLDDGIVLWGELFLSFLFFYGITFLIILIQPLVKSIGNKAYARKISKNIKKHNDKFKDMEEALENSEFE